MLFAGQAHTAHTLLAQSNKTSIQQTASTEPSWHQANTAAAKARDLLAASLTGGDVQAIALAESNSAQAQAQAAEALLGEIQMLRSASPTRSGTSTVSTPDSEHSLNEGSRSSTKPDKAAGSDEDAAEPLTPEESLRANLTSHAKELNQELRSAKCDSHFT